MSRSAIDVRNGREQGNPYLGKRTEGVGHGGICHVGADAVALAQRLQVAAGEREEVHTLFAAGGGDRPPVLSPRPLFLSAVWPPPLPPLG